MTKIDPQHAMYERAGITIADIDHPENFQIVADRLQSILSDVKAGKLKLCANYEPRAEVGPRIDGCVLIGIDLMVAPVR